MASIDIPISTQAPTNPIAELNGFKVFVYLQKTDISIPLFSQLQPYILELHNAITGRKYCTSLNDANAEFAKIFEQEKEYAQFIAKVLKGQTNSKDKNVWVASQRNGLVVGLHFLATISVGNQSVSKMIKISCHQVIDDISEKVKQLEDKLNRYLKESDKKDIESVVQQIIHYENPVINLQGAVSKEPKKPIILQEIESKEPKKSIKQKKQTSKQTQKEKESTIKEKSTDNISTRTKGSKRPKYKYRIQERKIKIEFQIFKVQISLGGKKDQEETLEFCINTINSSLNYFGTISNLEVSEFLQKMTKIANVIQLFNQVKNNIKNKEEQVVKVYIDQKKLEILIVVKNQKEVDRIYAEIDLKIVKEEDDGQKSAISQLKNTRGQKKTNKDKSEDNLIDIFDSFSAQPLVESAARNSRTPKRAANDFNKSLELNKKKKQQLEASFVDLSFQSVHTTRSRRKK